MKILCGVVTCNREKLLIRCINKINEQELKPDCLLIINHGDKLTSLESNINLIIINQKNEGSAAGWNRAIRYALDNNFNYIWLMDDDGYPDKKSLNLLIKNFKDHFSCLSSIVLREDKNEELVFRMPKIKNKFTNNLIGFKNIRNIQKFSKNNLYPFVHLFNGALINIKAVKKVGNVDINFKIYGEEVDYFYRLKKYGPIYTLVNSYHFHPNVNQKHISEQNFYYLLRNSIKTNNKYSKFKLIKNISIIIVSLYRVYNKNGLGFILKYVFSNKNLFFKSILDGYKK